ncbi:MULTISPECIES: antibiotic biosynthesis monooxygenase family protein [unclassified Leifsonia]|uniref:antibiotic biosynthesis monooxygenase family protein n=1 Tax=unclassified Leifsonia TaxID=2663824 RepID=UPI0006FDAE0C|nr:MULTISPECIES: antibiotic biosynthesis monooxygenase [unclassified Leifsonia]KQX07498.1 antibiotic biosynthesis monooxygenase [Leifsonia sp. Root1293]KRA11780.1 antibiotic biosynthesis monooxygenase [Leifsonia sp. Root60]
MILEHVVLPVRPGRESEFESAFAEARTIIERMPGFQRLSLSRGVESPSSYLLLVHWDSVEAHEVGFRGSEAYGRWAQLLHPFYDPFPVVEHFAEVHRA